LDALHLGLRVAQPGRRPRRHGLVDSPEVVGRELDAQGAEVLLQVGDALGAGDRHDVRSLGQEPGQDELRRGAALLARHLFQAQHQLAVVVEVLGLEARMLPAAVVRCDVAELLEPPREKAPAQR
jgi:hypothetical protein